MTELEQQRLFELLAELDDCDAYVVLVADPATEAMQAYGPLTGPAALHDADRRRRDLDARDLGRVSVSVVRYHYSRPKPPEPRRPSSITSAPLTGR